jgi:flagellar M-ring protein FliF
MNALGARQKLVVLGATLAMIIAVLGLTRLASAPNLALLYAGLENGAAGEVVSALEGRNIQFEVRGGAIFVPESERDALRLTLAAEGLPANGGQGYELLDGLSGFGTTSQMFDAAYWRAKEGELARTIVSNPQIASARVHIANASANPFQRDISPSASISVATTGGVLTAQQARALKFLVASAVPGLSADNVAVIDGKGGLIGADDTGSGAGTADDKATVLRDRVQRLMEARVGVGNAVVEVSVDTITESELIRERSFDPEGRVIVSTDTEERNDKSENSGGGDVTVASNLPEGAGSAGGDNSSSQKAESRERINYEVSETTREITRQPGAIRRLTVAVLVNGTYSTSADGTQQFAPLPDPELQALRDLVSSAVGFDEARGDAITIRSLAFEKPEGLGTGPIEPGLLAGPINMMRLIQMAVLAVVALVLGLFVVRPVLSGRSDATESAMALPAPASDAAVGDAPALEGEIEPLGGFGDLPVMGDGPDFSGMGMVDFDAPPEEDPVDRLRNLISERKTETVEILRSWLEEDKEGAS